MGQTTNGLIKSRTAASAIILARRLVKEGAADGTAVTAVDATAAIIGVSHDIDTAVGERCSVFMSGNIADVVYGGTVARGDALTADSTGRAITTTTTGARIVGFADVSGVVNDIGAVNISPGIL